MADFGLRSHISNFKTNPSTRVVQKVLSLIGFLGFISGIFFKCFTALEWCVEQLTMPVYFVQIAFQLTELFQIEIDAVIYTDQFTCYIGIWTRKLKFVTILNAALGLI